VNLALESEKGSLKLAETSGLAVYLDYAASAKGLETNLRCEPWAILAINGESVGRTPLPLPNLLDKPLDLDLRRPGVSPVQILLSAKRKPRVDSQ
jgi:hypothetical protein